MLLATLGLPLSHSNLISTGPKTEDQDGGPRVIWREWSCGCVCAPGKRRNGGMRDPVGLCRLVPGSPGWRRHQSKLPSGG